MNKKTLKNMSLKEIVKALEKAMDESQSLFSAWPDCRPLVEWLGPAVSACKGMSNTVAGTVVSPDLKKVAEKTVSKLPEDLKKSLDEVFDLNVEIVRRRFPVLNGKIAVLVYASAGLAKWLGGMDRPSFVTVAHNIIKAEKMGFDMFGLGSTEIMPQGSPYSVLGIEQALLKTLTGEE